MHAGQFAYFGHVFADVLKVGMQLSAVHQGLDGFAELFGVLHLPGLLEFELATCYNLEMEGHDCLTA